MKNFFKKLFVLVAILLPIFSITTTINSSSAFAADPDHTFGDCYNFLGMVSWDCNVPNIDSTDNLKSGVWLIAANILTDIGVIAAYLVIGYVIYGGYLYMFSSGDASKVASGKKTLLHAFIGLAVVMLTNVILNALRFALLNGSGAFSDNCVDTQCVDPSALVTNAINWIIGISGVVSAIFILVGGVGYVTSSGDAAKLQKAKNTIFYALIGLAVVALSEMIVIFVSHIVRDANSTSSVNQTLIAKEYYEDHSC